MGFSVSVLNKTDRIVVLFYIFLAISFSAGIIYIDHVIPKPKLIEEMTEISRDGNYLRTMNASQQAVFNVMIDVKDYPLILPQNVVTVNIVNQSNNIVYAKETLLFRGIKTEVLAKHTVHPFNEQIIEIMSGDAKGTTITQDFSQSGPLTTIITSVHFHFTGLLKFFGAFSGLAYSAQIDSVYGEIENYIKINQNGGVNATIDKLYREILYRPADPQGLAYYGTLLEQKKITPDEIRNVLMNSNEKKLALDPNSIIPIEQLDNGTKSTVDKLYREILYRPADPQGLAYYGTLLEQKKITPDELRKILMNSDEKKSLLEPGEQKTIYKLKNETKNTLDDLYLKVMLRHVDPQGLEYWGSLLEANKTTLEKIKAALMESGEYKTRVIPLLPHS